MDARLRLNDLLATTGTVVALLLGGCATVAPEPAPPSLFEDAAFGAPARAPDVAAVFALSPAMRDYLEHDIAPLIQRRGAQQGLVEALQARAQLRLEYDAEFTRTAAQAFDERAGNCLSLVVMSAALARHLNLPVTFQALVGHESWSRSGDLSFVNGHVNITVARRLIDRVGIYGTDALLRMEFGGIEVGRGQALREVSEARILAMFMNNRAAEHLVAGAVDDAYAHAREAIRQDPTYAASYNTLGVVYQRRGLPAAAERAYRAALGRDDSSRPALQNLARLLDDAGRAPEAAVFRDRLARIERDPPFSHFDRGVAAARAGDFATARDEIRVEMQRDPDYHEFHFWLAVALYGMGETQSARQHLEIAMRNSLTTRDQAIYAAKLRRLQAAAVAAPGR